MRDTFRSVFNVDLAQFHFIQYPYILFYSLELAKIRADEGWVMKRCLVRKHSSPYRIIFYPQNQWVEMEWDRVCRRGIENHVSREKNHIYKYICWLCLKYSSVSGNNVFFSIRIFQSRCRSIHYFKLLSSVRHAHKLKKQKQKRTKKNWKQHSTLYMLWQCVFSRKRYHL